MPTPKQRRAAIRKRRATKYIPKQQRREPRAIPEGFRRVRLSSLGPVSSVVDFCLDPENDCLLVEADGSPYAVTMLHFMKHIGSRGDNVLQLRGMIEIVDCDIAEMELRLRIA